MSVDVGVRVGVLVDVGVRVGVSVGVDVCVGALVDVGGWVGVLVEVGVWVDAGLGVLVDVGGTGVDVGCCGCGGRSVGDDGTGVAGAGGFVGADVGGDSVGGGGGFVCARVGVATVNRTPASTTKTINTRMSNLVVLRIIGSPR